jgi:hypothetical protein
VTLPPTDTFSAGGGSGDGSGLRLVLIVLAVIVSMVTTWIPLVLKVRK